MAFAKEAGAHITFFYAEPEASAAYLGLDAISAPHLTQEVHERLHSAAHDIPDTLQQVAEAADVTCQLVVLM